MAPGKKIASLKKQSGGVLGPVPYQKQKKDSRRQRLKKPGQENAKPPEAATKKPQLAILQETFRVWVVKKKMERVRNQRKYKRGQKKKFGTKINRHKLQDYQASNVGGG